MQALIGQTGLIGQILCSQREFDHCFTTRNIDLLPNTAYDTVYCSAPSGNRIQAEQDPQADSASVDRLISALTRTDIGRIVLISTGDTQVNPGSTYGANRLRLEQAVSQHSAQHHIIRLSSLIHATIKKNILYDIRNQQYIDRINPRTQLQWYPLVCLIEDIDRAIQHDIAELNLCSEPIVNQAIIDRWGTAIASGIKDRPAGPAYDLKPYRHTQEEIFQYIEEYFQ